MAGFNLTSQTMTFGDMSFSGGLNTSAGLLSLKDNESPDLQNIDFNVFGSIVKRNGYDTLNSAAITNSPNSDGLHWYEYDSSGTTTRHLLNVADGKLFKMDDLDGTWDNVTGTLTITADNYCDFTNFLNEVYITNGVDVPFKWTGSGNGATMNVPANLTDAKYNEEYENYLFLANVAVDGTVYKSRIYWCTIKDTTTWSSLAFIDIAKDDGQEITRIKKLGDKLIVYKTRSIYNVLFTGDADIPFIVKKSNSSVGCVAPFSIQEFMNGHVFLSYDGFYYYDGNNSIRISDKITPTLTSLNINRFSSTQSLVQNQKNKYWCALTSSGGSENDRVFVFDYTLGAWSLYVGMSLSSCCTVYIDGVEERPYFGDYDGFVYRADYGVNDNPIGVETAVSAYYYTNWRHYGDLINKKGVPQCVIYYQTSESVLTFAYTYDFQSGDQYSSNFSLSGGGDVYGSATWDSSTYGYEGGGLRRRDLTGRGRVVRFKFENNTIDEAFQVDGLGTAVYLETNV